MAQNTALRRSGLAGLLGLGAIRSVWDRFFGAPPILEAPVIPVPEPRAYLVRKRNLPQAFTGRDWEAALDYWGHRCAVCERPRGLWHTLAQDHWIPLTASDCPGTVPTNILPLCHGTDGCNNSKGKKLPVVWLREKLGPRRANRKLREIEAYFDWAESHASIRLGCPDCGAPVHQHGTGADTHYHCRSCALEWDDAQARNLAHCPLCNCFMMETHYRSGLYSCPRCCTTYEQHELRSLERCPGCKHGVLEWWSDQVENWWRCRDCAAEWVDD